MDDKIRVAVIGCGYWGPNLIRNFNQLDSANLDYACDIDNAKIESIKKIYPNIKITRDYQEILRDPEISAVVLALPVSEHYKVARDSLLAGKHVLVEKPMTSNVEEAKELIRIAKEKNKMLMVDHTFEYSEAINRIKKIVESGELGELFYIRAEWLNLGLLQPDINVLWDLAPHIISTIIYITGFKPKSLNAKAEGHIRGDIPEVAQVNIKFYGGLSAYFTTSWLEPKKTRSMTIVGSKKLLIYDLTNTEEPIKIYDKNVELIQDEDIRQRRMNYKYGDIVSPSIKNIEPLSVMCKHFIECIKTNKQPTSNGESGLRVVKVLEATERSMKNQGKEIILDEDIL